MRAQRGNFLCWSEKEQLEGKKGGSAGGESSRGPDLCDAGLPLGKELWDRENCSCLQVLWTKRDSKESQDKEKDDLSTEEGSPHARNQTTDLYLPKCHS